MTKTTFKRNLDYGLGGLPTGRLFTGPYPGRAAVLMCHRVLPANGRGAETGTASINGVPKRAVAEQIAALRPHFHPCAIDDLKVWITDDRRPKRKTKVPVAVTRDDGNEQPRLSLSEGHSGTGHLDILPGLTLMGVGFEQNTLSGMHSGIITFWGS